MNINFGVNNYLKYLLLILILVLLSACSSSPESELKKGYKMGTVVKVKVYGTDSAKLAEKSFGILTKIEQKMSSNIVDSEISQINQAAGKERVVVSTDTYNVLNKAVQYSKLSHGAFDPTIGPLVNLWGIGSKEEKIPSKKKIKQKLDLIDYKKIKLFNQQQVFLTESRMKLDVGAIAKGYAADKVINYFKDNNVKSAFIDIGGNVSVLGTKANGELWTVGIQAPKQSRGQVLATVNIKDRTIVTSGNYERYFTQDGIRYHHILNPETGYPAKKGIISSTIIAEKSFDADALSTAVYILGLEQGLELINSLENTEAIIVTEDNKLYLTANIEDKVKVLKKSQYQIKIR